MAGDDGVDVVVRAEHDLAEREVGSVADAMAVVAAPSCTSSTMMSASPLLDLPSLNWSATRFAASTGGPTVRSSMPAGLTSEGSSSVTAPTNPI